MKELLRHEKKEGTEHRYEKAEAVTRTLFFAARSFSRCL